MSPPCGIKVWFGHKIHEYRTRKNVTLTHWSDASITRFAMILSWIILIFPRSHGLKKKETLLSRQTKAVRWLCWSIFVAFMTPVMGILLSVQWEVLLLELYKYYLAVYAHDNIRLFSRTRHHKTFSRMFGTQQRAKISFLWSLYLLKIHFPSLNQTWTLVVLSCKNWRTAARPIKPEDKLNFLFLRLFICGNLWRLSCVFICFSAQQTSGVSCIWNIISSLIFN